MARETGGRVLTVKESEDLAPKFLGRGYRNIPVWELSVRALPKPGSDIADPAGLFTFVDEIPRSVAVPPPEVGDIVPVRWYEGAEQDASIAGYEQRIWLWVFAASLIAITVAIVLIAREANQPVR